MSFKESSYLSQMYHSDAPSEKVNQEPPHLLQEINRDLNDNFEAQEQQQQEYSRISVNDKKPPLSFFYSDEQYESQQPEIMTNNMTFRHRLERFYTQYCPDKNNQLGIMVNKYTWKEEAWFKSLEKKYLEILEKYNISPKIIESNGETLILTDCGEILNKENTPLDWKEQIRDIYQILKNENIYHNDIKPDNITVKENKIYLIDYGWGSENIPEYPYLNLTSEIIEKSQTIEELFHHIYNKSSDLTLKCALNINKYLNENLRGRF